MIINNIVKLGTGSQEAYFTITSVGGGELRKLVNGASNLEVSRENLPGNPPYTVKAEGGCGSDELRGLGADDLVTYYWARFPEGGKRGENKLLASTRQKSGPNASDD
jgi:hypothetical protein